MSVYASSRNVKTTLVRIGSLKLNAIPGETPTPYLDATWSAHVPVADNTLPDTLPDFTHPESVGTILSTYDDVVIDMQPRVTALGKVTSNWTTEPYRLLRMYERPFWILVRCDGYNVPTRQTSAKALETALAVMTSIWADMLTYHLTRNFAGFAFYQPNLNVKFPDESVITRLFQNTLVQQAHVYERPCMFITTRPNDVTDTIGQEIAGNLNSKLPLPFSIIGNNAVYRDRILAMYPYPITSIPNLTIILALFGSFRKLLSRDGVTPLNVDCGLVVEPDPALFTIDKVTGLKQTGEEVWPRLRELTNFLHALGITSIGIKSGPAGDVVPVPQLWAPEFGNTSGSWSQVWSEGDTLSVEYTASDGTIAKRNFTKDLIEL